MGAPGAPGSLDFGGFAKGYSVGNAVELIETKGIKNFIVNAGGDLCTRGSRGKRPWQIGIRDPDGSGIFAKISVKTNGCIFTSGGYERYFWHNGRRYHHILDPRTGYPASGSASATVITEDPTLADAASTAIFVAGPAYLEEISKSMGIRYFLLIDEEGNVFISDQLLDQIEFIERPKSVTKISLEHLRAQ